MKNTLLLIFSILFLSVSSASAQVGEGFVYSGENKEAGVKFYYKPDSLKRDQSEIVFIAQRYKDENNYLIDLIDADCSQYVFGIVATKGVINGVSGSKTYDPVEYYKAGQGMFITPVLDALCSQPTE